MKNDLEAIEEYVGILEEQHLAVKRKDLPDDLGITVGDEFIYDRGFYPYRWRHCKDGKDILEIKYNGEWREASSIDWDFV